MERKAFAGFLTGNQLKLLAVLFMTLDHIGLQIYPQYEILRILGRLALPIFGYMIAEGCRYTKNRARYLGCMAAVALVCQLVYFYAMHSLYQCIFVTFSLSICLIYTIDYVREKRTVVRFAVLALVFAGIVFLTEDLQKLLPGTDFCIDYGLWGVLLPVAVYGGRTRIAKWCMAAFAIVMLGVEYGGEQWYALFALLLLVLYNGKRGKWRMKYAFYIYYPLHLILIYLWSLYLQ